MNITENIKTKGIEFAKANAGHSSIAMTELYNHLSMDDYHIQGYTKDGFKN